MTTDVRKAVGRPDNSLFTGDGDAWVVFEEFRLVKLNFNCV